MRILFAVLSPLNPELGASQMALNLAAALRGLGNEVVVWTPHPVPPNVRWWRRMAWVRRAIAEYVERNGPFDAVDLPPVAASPALSRRCAVVARHVQPDLQYLWMDVRFAARLRRVRLHALAASVVFNAYLAALVVAGWSRARLILCLGSLDHTWMRRRFPWWRHKIGMYLNALHPDERRALAEIRRNRASPAGPGVRYLWLGRWAAHKGNDILVEFASRHLAAHPHDTITVAGCGSEAAAQIPRQLLESRRVKLIDSYTRERLLELLASHDAGLFTSRTEGWGLTLQEMLESGMPVHATNAGAVPDIRHAFPNLLRAFPPGASRMTPWPQPDCLPPDYFTRFSWHDIAIAYRKRLHDAISGLPHDRR